MIQQATRPNASATAMRSYLNDISRIPLLERSQEIEYGRQIQIMQVYRQSQLELVQELGREPSLEDWAARIELTIDELEGALESGELAKRHMVEANLRLVVNIAKQYQHCNVDLLDLIQEGAIGLQRGAEKFDPTRGYRFSTYAHWWIRQAMTRAISQSSRTVRLPVHLVEILNKIRRSQRELSQKLGRIASMDEVAKHLNLEPDQVRQYLIYARHPMSLEKRVGENADTELQDLLIDNSVLPIERAERNELSQGVREAIEQLPPNMREILVSRFGLDGGKPLSLTEVGSQLGMSRERVRQLQQRAYNLIRQRNADMRKHVAS
jgi:RNA polymerase nonessential primary-like sigma factor